MKTYLHNLLLGGLLAAAPIAFAQSPTAVLNAVITDASQISTEVAANGAALKSLVVDYFINGNPSPDVDGFVSITNARQTQISALQGNVTGATNLAAILDPYINPTNFLIWAAQIESLGDEIEAESANLRLLILAGDDAGATVSAQSIRADLLQQYDLARLIKREASYYRTAQASFDVRISLEDYLGNPVTGSTGLMGYYAYNEYTGEYVYPEYLYADEFLGLRAGTWTFGAFNGYFDGASSNTVNLRSALVQPDGYIPVTLQYWSE